MLQEMLEQYDSLSIFQKRSLSEEYHELVFFNNELEEWDKIVSGFLGEPIKPKGSEPTQENESLTEQFGGIMAHQTLFRKDFKDATILAMFWPWQDNTHTTLKMAIVKKQLA